MVQVLADGITVHLFQIGDPRIQQPRLKLVQVSGIGVQRILLYMLFFRQIAAVIRNMIRHIRIPPFR